MPKLFSLHLIASSQNSDVPTSMMSKGYFRNFNIFGRSAAEIGAFKGAKSELAGPLASKKGGVKTHSHWISALFNSVVSQLLSNQN